ncbi:MAG: rhomboid family intramembrane serine protease [Planctomycetota bacterium]
MIMPLYDDNSQRIRTPFVNYILIAINIFVFVMFQNFGENERFIYTFSAVPAEIISGKDIQSSPTVLGKTRSGEEIIRPGLEPTPFTVYITLITSMFMHGGIGHILGNMLFLWIFGDNVEDRLGHLQYLLFYIIVGILASLAHVATCVLLKSDLLTPSLGASGAISGVMGAYLLFYPNNSVTVLIFRFVTTVPAIVAVGLWFAMQLFSSVMELGAGEGGGVAYGAHIGGFIAGIPLAFFIDKAFGDGKQNVSWTESPNIEG